MKRILVLLLFSGYAVGIDVEQFVQQLCKVNLQLKIIELEKREAKHWSHLTLGRYDFVLALNSTYSYDRSIQNSPVMPSNTEVLSGVISLSKKWAGGMSSSVFMENSNTSFDTTNLLTGKVEGHEPVSSKLGMTLNVSLAKNLFGQVERMELENRQKEYELALISARDKAESLIVSGLSSYLQWVFNLYNLNIYTEMLGSARELLAKALARRRAGIIDDRELYIYRSNLSALEQLHLQAEYAQTELLNHIKYLLNTNEEIVPGQLEILPKESLAIEKIKNQDVESLANFAVQMVRGMKQTEVAENNVRRFRNERLPDVNFQLSAKGTGNDSDEGISRDDAFSLQNPQYSASLNVIFPLENTVGREQFHMASLALLRAQNNELDIENNVILQLKSLRAKVLALNKGVEISRKHQENELKKYQNELKEYRRGRSNARDVVQFQNEYLQSKLRHQLSLVDLKTAIYSYLRTSGGLLEFYGIKTGEGY